MRIVIGVYEIQKLFSCGIGIPVFCSFA